MSFTAASYCQPRGDRTWVLTSEISGQVSGSVGKHSPTIPKVDSLIPAGVVSSGKTLYLQISETNVGP